MYFNVVSFSIAALLKCSTFAIVLSIVDYNIVLS